MKKKNEVFGKEYISNENMKAEQKGENKVFLICFLSAFRLKEKRIRRMENSNLFVSEKPNNRKIIFHIKKIEK